MFLSQEFHRDSYVCQRNLHFLRRLLFETVALWDVSVSLLDDLGIPPLLPPINPWNNMTFVFLQLLRIKRITKNYKDSIMIL